MKVKPFFDNKYTRWYFSIIDKAKSEARKKLPMNNAERVYYEKHHIMPKSMGGKETVLLTAKEHFLCHLLLTKMTDDLGMKCALARFIHGNKDQQKYRITSTIYEYLKRQRSIASSEHWRENNPMSNAESREKHRLAALNRTQEQKDRARLAQVESKDNKYIIRHPNSELEVTNYLSEFLREHNLIKTHMFLVITGRAQHHKGFAAMRYDKTKSLEENLEAAEERFKYFEGKVFIKRGHKRYLLSADL